MQLSDRIGRRLKLQDLHVLMTVVQAGSMGKAAQQLNTTQPDISRSIAELEHAFGVRLLDRHRQGIAPTEYGRALARLRNGRIRRLAPGREEDRVSRRPWRRRSADRKHHLYWPKASFLPSSIGSPGVIRASCFISSRRTKQRHCTVNLSERNVDFLIARKGGRLATSDLDSKFSTILHWSSWRAHEARGLAGAASRLPSW